MLFRSPASVELDVAAAVMLQGMTAHYLTHSTFELKPGHTCLIHAAAGGTGRLLVQMAAMIGARVIATVGSDEKAQLTLGDGASVAINYSTHDFVEEVKKVTDGKGIGVVVKLASGATTWFFDDEITAA